MRRWHDGWAAESAASWAVVDPRDGEPVGRVGFRTISLEGGLAEVNYWVLPRARRRGVARAALNELARWAFRDIGFQRLDLMHSVYNTASCRVAASGGFAAEGILRGAVLHLDGWHDMHLHGRVRTDGTHLP